MPSDYQFGRRAPACSACSREFRPGEEYRSGLIPESPAQPAAPPAAAGEASAGGGAPEGGAAPLTPSGPPADAVTPAAPVSGAAAAPGGGLPFRRVDLCSGCWDESRAAGFFSCWKARVPEESDAADRRKPLARSIDPETIYDMFRRLEGHADPEQQKFRFILALMLMRGKRLKFTGVVDSPHGEHLVLDDRDEGVSHKVLDPGLSDEEVERLRGNIDRLLGGGSEAGPEPAAAEAAPSAEGTGSAQPQ